MEEQQGQDNITVDELLDNQLNGAIYHLEKIVSVLLNYHMKKAMESSTGGMLIPTQELMWMLKIKGALQLLPQHIEKSQADRIRGAEFIHKMMGTLPPAFMDVHLEIDENILLTVKNLFLTFFDSIFESLRVSLNADGYKHMNEMLNKLRCIHDVAKETGIFDEETPKPSEVAKILS